jgi:signal peptidase II
MQKRSRLTPIIVFAVLAVGIAALDLWTKSAIFRLLEVESVGSPPHVTHQVERSVVPGWFDLQAHYNDGAFRGWFSSHTGWLTTLSAVALVVLLGLFAVQFRGGGRPGVAFSTALALLWAGTLGNLYDRAMLGAVRDWIKWFVVIGGEEHIWPNFNIADSAICTGVGLWILLEVLASLRERRAKRERAATR